MTVTSHAVVNPIEPILPPEISPKMSPKMSQVAPEAQKPVRAGAPIVLHLADALPANRPVRNHEQAGTLSHPRFRASNLPDHRPIATCEVPLRFGQGLPQNRPITEGHAEDQKTAAVIGYLD